jgi:hypothetical protein
MSQLLTDEEISQLRAQSGLHCGERFLENLGDEFAEFAISFEQAVLAKLGAQEPVAYRKLLKFDDGTEDWKFASIPILKDGELLYAAPPIPGGMAKDAARYQWLRDPDQAVGHVIDKKSGSIWEYRAGEELDAAIDAAMLAARSKAAE